MRVLIGGLLGAGIGAFFCAAAFFAGALVNDASLSEAIGFSLVVAVVGALLGGLTGLLIGALKLRPFAGAAVGLIISLAVVAFYVLAFGREGRYSYFLSESRVIIAGLTTPLILTSSLVAWLQTILEQRRQ